MLSDLPGQILRDVDMCASQKVALAKHFFSVLVVNKVHKDWTTPANLNNYATTRDVSFFLDYAAALTSGPLIILEILVRGMSLVMCRLTLKIS